MLTTPRRSKVADRVDSVLVLVPIAALTTTWATHVLGCVTKGLWAWLIVGLLMPPVAVLHGLAVLVTTWV